MTLIQLDLEGKITMKVENKSKINEIDQFLTPPIRKNLVVSDDLKTIFRDIRNHLAGMTSGITRDEVFAHEMVKILFCKIYDEKNTKNSDTVKFHALQNEAKKNCVNRMSNLFSHIIKKYPESFKKNDKINLDENSLHYTISSLQNFCITESDRDAIGDVFEVFIGPALRGGEGQFFTPKNAVEMMVKIIDPKPGELILDPACGAGGFLTASLTSIWSKLNEIAEKEKWSKSKLNKQKTESASKFFGIDKDNFQSTISKAFMSLLGDGISNIFCDNSLRNFFIDKDSISKYVKQEQFDIILTNPPFGSKIKITGNEILSQYNLARVWKNNKNNQWIQTEKILKQQAPQILFIERCLQLLKPGGRLGIILPEGIFGNPSSGYIVEYIRQNAKFLGLVTFPDELFQPGTHSKTCALFLEKIQPPKNYEFFMGIAKWCGHDSRGNKIPYDDIPKISERYFTKSKDQKKLNYLGFMKRISSIKNNIIIPKYYDPDIQTELNQLKKTHDIVTIQSLVDENKISLSTGVEIGKLNYGTGSIPFIRTSDISNWEIKIDPKQGVNSTIFNEFKKKCDLQENDILMVRDGTYLIGTTTMITKHDVKSLFQSHILKIRVLETKSFSPYILMAILNSDIVKKQIRAKQFTQDIIDTLGKRILEIQIPIPKNKQKQIKIANDVQHIIYQRSDLREKVKEISKDIMN
jgi:type I restriction enzyme M protein